ncbi:hypothetical protein BDR26DRAFT_938659 [Obelidium mucronatum]|nr:hypothetical protein BDR26DRAFT_938659 [Obelidium mucronatum]
MLPPVWQLFNACSTSSLDSPSLPPLQQHPESFQQFSSTLSPPSHPQRSSISPFPSPFQGVTACDTPPLLWTPHNANQPPPVSPQSIPQIFASPESPYIHSDLHLPSTQSVAVYPTIALKNQSKPRIEIPKKRTYNIRKKGGPIAENLHCKLCDVKFSRKYDLTRHNQSLHPSSVDECIHECHICGKWFSRPDALMRHVRVSCTASCDKRIRM